MMSVPKQSSRQRTAKADPMKAVRPYVGGGVFFGVALPLGAFTFTSVSDAI
jgi:hypothetical protein